MRTIRKIGIACLGGLMAVPMALATYTANYSPSDMPNIFSDLIGHFAVNAKVYVPLIVLIAIVVWAYVKFGYKPKRRKF